MKVVKLLLLIATIAFCAQSASSNRRFHSSRRFFLYVSTARRNVIAAASLNRLASQTERCIPNCCLVPIRGCRCTRGAKRFVPRRVWMLPAWKPQAVSEDDRHEPPVSSHSHDLAGPESLPQNQTTE